MAFLERLRYVVLDSFYSLPMDHDSEPIIIVDGDSHSSPRRLFVVKYVLASADENSRLIFKNQPTGYDYEQQIIYPIQKSQLDHLQSVMETFAYGSANKLARVENPKGEFATGRVIISNELVSEIIGTYHFAW
jgi:hypothetical protein